MNGADRLLNLLTSHVGTGSSWHVFLAAGPISFTTSFGVTGVQSLRECLAVADICSNGVDAVDLRTLSTLSAKKSAKSSASY